MRLWIACACCSIAAHAALMMALASPPRSAPKRIEMELGEAPRPPPRPEPIAPPPPPIERAIVKRVVKKASLPQPVEAPPPPAVGVDEASLAVEGGMVVASGVTLDGVIGTGTGTIATKEAAPNGRGHGRKRQVPIFAVTRLPKAKAVIEPDVPASYRSETRDIVVVVELDIDVRGRVEEVRVIRGGGVELDRAVVRAAEKTEFEPALVGSDPVPVRYRIPYRIRVRG